MTPDVNVLVAAFRPMHVHHREARRWLGQALDACGAGGTVEVLPSVAAGFLRIVTSRRIFPAPAPMADAVAFLAVLLDVPGVVMPPMGPEWKVFAKLCVDLKLDGNSVPDAWIAAAVSAGGYHLVTFDADFGRLLRPTEYTLLGAGEIREPKARYGVRRRALLDVKRRQGSG